MRTLCVIRQDQASFEKLLRPMRGMLIRRHLKLLRSGMTLANPQIGAMYSSELISNRDRKPTCLSCGVRQYYLGTFRARKVGQIVGELLHPVFRNCVVIACSEL